jgi:nucleotide-binding universal stress UspA family protein
MDRVIVWSVDAFEPPGDLINSAVRVLQVLSRKLDADVIPVYVLTPSQINLSTEFSEIYESPSTEYYRPAAENALKQAVKECAIPRMLEPRVVTIDSSSTHMAIDGLSRFADGLGAEAIVLSSHGRSGLGRFLLGSFAETLILYSKRPVVVVHPGAKVAEGTGFRKLLVPTDLSEGSFSFWEDSLHLAKRMDLEVLLFHSVPYPVEPVIQSGVYLLSGGWMPLHAYMSEEVQRRQQRLDLWVDHAKQMGVQAKGSIYAEGGGTAEAILRTAKEENTSLICMAVQSGPITSAIIGSVTREVVRRSVCPVWVLRHTKGGKASKVA